MALRLDVLEAAGARSSERRRAWADSSKRASVPDAEPPPRARWSTRFSPRAPVSLTRRLRRAVGLWLCGLESPGSRLRPSFFGDVTFFYTVTAPPRPAPPRAAPPRAAPPCAAPPAPSLQRRLRSAAFAATPLPRRLRRLTPHAAPPRAAPPRPAPHRTAPPPSPAQRPRREAVSPPRAARRLV